MKFCVSYSLFRKITKIFQGRRRLLESGTAIEHHWCSPSADGTRGGGGRERMRGHKGGLGDLPQEKFVIQDD